MWANLLYMFTISFFPVMTAWVGQTNFAKFPTIIYVSMNLINAIAFIILEHAIITSHDCEILKNAVKESKKEHLTILIEVIALICAFFNPVRFLSYILLLIMAGMWIIPDLRFHKIYNKVNNKE